MRVILLTQALGPLDYRVPNGMDVQAGSVVIVPLGPRKMLGVIWDEGVFPGDMIEEKRLRNIIETVPIPPIKYGLRRLVDWVAEYYLSNHASVLRMILSSSAALAEGGTITEYRLSGIEPPRMTPQRAAAMDALIDMQGRVSELADEAGVSVNIIRGLIKSGAFEPVTISADAPFDRPDPDFAAPFLNAEQSIAANAVIDAVKKQEFAAFLLDGVTGSGKTET